MPIRLDKIRNYQYCATKHFCGFLNCQLWCQACIRVSHCICCKTQKVLEEEILKRKCFQLDTRSTTMPMHFLVTNPTKVLTTLFHWTLWKNQEYCSQKQKLNFEIWMKNQNARQIESDPNQNKRIFQFFNAFFKSASDRNCSDSKQMILIFCFYA